MARILFDLLTLASILFGMFFMFVGVVGVYRLPDVYCRMHAASKCVTLGLSGLLLGAIFHAATRPEVGLVPTIIMSGLVILFQFVAAPIGCHMLARAAHADGVAIFDQTLGDELTDDMCD